MTSFVMRGDRIQAWIDKEGTQHVVLYSSEPHKLLCSKRTTMMWGYSPRLAPVEDITCTECRNNMESVT